MHVSGLFIYPVKSLRGVAVSAAEIDPLGLVGDRRFLVVDPSGRMRTQRTLARMARIATALSRDSLTLSADGAGSIATPLSAAGDDAAIKVVSVWKSEGLRAEDCGDEIAAWLGSVLETPCRLVRIGANFHRPVLKQPAVPGDVVSFADSVPMLVISEASLADLNARIAAKGEKPVPMERFRPNVVIAGVPAFAEDTWTRARLGRIVIRAAGPCVRCIMPSIDQMTGETGKEPLPTLASYRRAEGDSNGVIFGQNFIHETKAGVIRVGDEVEAARE